jgi:hypothetical protein
MFTGFVKVLAEAGGVALLGRLEGFRDDGPSL